MRTLFESMASACQSRLLPVCKSLACRFRHLQTGLAYKLRHDAANKLLPSLKRTAAGVSAKWRKLPDCGRAAAGRLVTRLRGTQWHNAAVRRLKTAASRLALLPRLLWSKPGLRKAAVITPILLLAAAAMNAAVSSGRKSAPVPMVKYGFDSDTGRVFVLPDSQPAAPACQTPPAAGQTMPSVTTNAEGVRPQPPFGPDRKDDVLKLLFMLKGPGADTGFTWFTYSPLEYIGAPQGIESKASGISQPLPFPCWLATEIRVDGKIYAPTGYGMLVKENGELMAVNFEGFQLGNRPLLTPLDSNGRKIENRVPGQGGGGPPPPPRLVGSVKLARALATAAI